MKNNLKWQYIEWKTPFIFTFLQMYRLHSKVPVADRRHADAAKLASTSGETFLFEALSSPAVCREIQQRELDDRKRRCLDSMLKFFGFRHVRRNFQLNRHKRFLVQWLTERFYNCFLKAGIFTQTSPKGKRTNFHYWVFRKLKRNFQLEYQKRVASQFGSAPFQRLGFRVLLEAFDS